jgi:hypothetical protein
MKNHLNLQRLRAVALWVTILFVFPSCGNNTGGTLCVYGSKEVYVENNTASNLIIKVYDGFNTNQLGGLGPFQTRTYSYILYSTYIQAEDGSGLFREFYVDPCVRDLNFIIED